MTTEQQARSGPEEPVGPPEILVDRVIRSQKWLDPPAEAVQKAVGWFFTVLGVPGRELKSLLHGTKPLGHPLHPALTDIPLGAWSVGVIADWIAILTGKIPTQAGDVALAIGLLGALLALLSGYTDFHETFGHERRTAFTHGLTMTGVIVIEAISLALRWWGGSGLHVLAVVLATAGILIALVGAYIGGHLVFGMGTMVNHNAFATGGPVRYAAVGAAADFPEGQMRRVDARGLPVLIVRLKGRLYAIASVCSHAGGPLDKGTLVGEVVTCPWHGSQFRVTDGRVRGGPATFNQPALLARERDGHVEVRLAHPLH